MLLHTADGNTPTRCINGLAAASLQYHNRKCATTLLQCKSRRIENSVHFTKQWAVLLTTPAYLCFYFEYVWNRSPVMSKTL